MNIELSKEDLMLINMLLSKEEGMTRVEIHHCFSRDYKNFLKEREKHIGDLLARIKEALAAIKE
ncbi:MAG: hypothetical protein HXY44_15615 [Syntrophaceae bacterium]|nr:hypothetical protein [Syntrophaceae bacterium]